MKDEPEIVKNLRKSEKLGKLRSKSDNISQELSKETKLDDAIIENSIERDTRNFGFNKDIDSVCCENENLYRKLIENSLEGILIIDIKGKILFANSAIKKIFGFKSIEENIGEKISEYIDPSYHNKLIKNQQLVDNIQEGFLDSYKVITADKRKIWIEEIVTKIMYKGEKANVLFIRDITKRQKTWDDLVKLEEKYRVLAETSADGIITIDPLGRLTYVNPSFEKMCMRGKKDILSTLFREYLSDHSVYLYQQIFIDSRKMNKRINNVELELVPNNGEIIPIEINMSPLKKEGKFTGMVCTIRDITERKKIENELKKSERFKTEFMNIAAHELKSPVTPIKGYLDLIISDEKTDDKIKNWAKISLRNSERLIKLISDILDVSRLNSDTMRFEMEKLNPVEIIDEIVEDLKPIIENKNLEFIINIPKNIPFILGDRFRLVQALRNIVGNAIKFTDNGSISIVAKLEDDNIIISVEDTGIGISNYELKKIFNKFYQAYMGSDRKNEGTGLGLYICKEIIERHNGTITAISKLKKGSKFMIKIPYL